MWGDMETDTVDLSDDLRIEELADNNAIADDPLAQAGAASSAGGGFVASFAMTAREEAAAVAMTRTQLAQLQAECDPSDDVVNGWRRVRGKKGSRVKLWERGSASALTLTRVDANTPTARRHKNVPVQKTSHRNPQKKRHLDPFHADSPDPAASPSSSSRIPPRVEKETYAVRSSITVHAPLASVMTTLDCATATSYRSFTKIIYEALVADTSVLSYKKLSTPGDEAHVAESVAVRWIVAKCSSPLVSDCDLCLVEYSKVHSIDELAAAGAAPSNNAFDQEEEQRGRALRGHDGLRARERLPVAYKVLRSMETKHCPVLSDAPHHLERLLVPLGGFLLYPTERDDATDVVFFMAATYERKKQISHGPATFLSSDERQLRAIQQVLHQLALGIGRIANAVDAYAMSLQLEALKLTQWIENADRSECVVCYRRFHPITRRRHHCRMCGDVICRECSIHKDADLPTIGPTTLRICKLCNVQHFGRSSAFASIAIDAKHAASVQQRREIALETTAFPSPTMQRQRRQTTMSVETPTSISKRSLLVESPHGAGRERANTLRRYSMEQPVSCPKSTREVPRRITERWAKRNGVSAMPSPTHAATPGKWSKAFTASRAALSATSPLPRHSAMTPTSRPPTQSYSPPTRFAQTMPVPRSASKEVQHHAPSHSQRFNFNLMKGSPMSPLGRPRQQSSGESILDSPLGQFKTAPMRSSSTAPPQSTYATPPPPRKSSDSSRTGNQSSSSERDRLQSHRSSLTTLGRRARIAHVDKFEDLLREMCERASDATLAKYAAVSVFVPQDPAKSASDSAVLTMAHYLKVRGAPKLMKIAANMRCCEPVLRAVKPIVTRNALTYRLDGYDFSSLPVVKGPQQARFYAGVPLIDSSQRLIGALAVFDSKFVDDDDEDLLDSPGLLASVARATIVRIESRQAEHALEVFMKNPVVRQSEPMAISRPGGGTPGDVADADDVDEESVRTVSRMTTVPSSTPLYRQGASSTPKTNNSVEFYKRQMQRLVQQANQTQDQVMQNAIKMQGVNF